MEKTALINFKLKRSWFFWIGPVLGLLFLSFIGWVFSLSFPSLLIGVFISYVNVEFLIHFHLLRFYIIKYVILFGALYFLIPYLSVVSFLIGLSGFFFYLIGFCIEVLRDDTF